MNIHLLHKIAMLSLACVLCSKVVASPDLPKSEFAEQGTRTQYSIVFPHGVECFFSPCKLGHFLPIGYSKMFGHDVPAMFLPSHLLEELSEVSQNYVEYFGYGELFPEPNFGDTVTFKVNGVDFTFVMIPGGTYTMGSPEDEVGRYDDELQKEVEVAPFMMMQHEVTQIQWLAIMGDNPSAHKSINYPNLPVENVSHNKVKEFIVTLNALLAEQGQPGFRLPTEEQWEYAARAGSITRYPWGDGEKGLATYAWGRHNANNRTHQIMELAPNAWGLYDMLGNVCEWTDSFYNNGRDSQPMVVRGGSWLEGPRGLRSAVRDYWGPRGGGNTLGFRLLFITS